MRLGERAARAVRHSRLLRERSGVWDALRPAYLKAVDLVWGGKLTRNLNGTDEIYLDPDYRSIPEQYEPAIWAYVMERLREGDVVADVGAHVGVYTVAIAKRVGSAGHVYAFEPDAGSYSDLVKHIEMNGVADRCTPVHAAAGERSEKLAFASGLGMQSHLAAPTEEATTMIDVVALAEVLPSTRLDLLKIDVEGYEELVLRGAVPILLDRDRRPGAIVVELHPYAWPELGSSWASIVDLLDGHGYSLTDSTGSSPTFTGEMMWLVATTT